MVSVRLIALELDLTKYKGEILALVLKVGLIVK